MSDSTSFSPEGPNPSGICQCGCGERTRIAPRDHKRDSWVKGKPIRFVPGHQHHISPVQYIIDPVTQCWEWQRGGAGKGYGQLHVEGVKVYAHRYFFEEKYGLIPEGLAIDHLCKNRICVNPEHMEAVSQRINVLRGEGIPAENARKTHCPQGHPYNEENTLIEKDGGRRCRTCRRERSAASYRK